MIDLESLPLMTRGQAVAFLNGRGIPITLDALKHACRNGGPTPYARWGKSFLYEPKELLRWAHSKLDRLPDAYRQMNKSENRDAAIS